MTGKEFIEVMYAICTRYNYDVLTTYKALDTNRPLYEWWQLYKEYVDAVAMFVAEEADTKESTTDE